MRPIGKCCVQIYAEITSLRSGGVRQIAEADYLFNGLGDKAGQLTRLAPSADTEIKERISASTPSYTTDSIGDTFKLGRVFASFYY